MAIRRNESTGFVDAMVAELSEPRSSALLTSVDAAIPWRTLEAPILAQEENSNDGAARLAWDPALAFQPPLAALVLRRGFRGGGHAAVEPSGRSLRDTRDRAASPMATRGCPRARPAPPVVRGRGRGSLVG